jgi:hypothetical protein
LSVKIMSAVWECEGLDATERLVMLSLADHADDMGRCYPSIARLCQRTSMSDRGVQKVLGRLVERGFISVKPGAGQSGANLYTLSTPEPGSPRTTFTPPNDVHPKPRTTFTPPPNPVPNTPEPGSPKPSENRQREEKKEGARQVALCLEQWASPASVASFIAYRKGHKSKGLTLTGAKRLAGNLKAILDANGDTDDALAMAEEKGWASVEPDWYFKAKGNGNGKSGRAQFDVAHREFTRRLAAGEVRRGPDPSDPFAR